MFQDQLEYIHKLIAEDGLSQREAYHNTKAPTGAVEDKPVGAFAYLTRMDLSLVLLCKEGLARKKGSILKFCILQCHTLVKSYIVLTKIYNHKHVENMESENGKKRRGLSRLLKAKGQKAVNFLTDLSNY